MVDKVDEVEDITVKDEEDAKFEEEIVVDDCTEQIDFSMKENSDYIFDNRLDMESSIEQDF